MAVHAASSTARSSSSPFPSAARGPQEVSLFADLSANHHEPGCSFRFLEPLVGGFVRVTQGGFECLRQFTDWTECEQFFVCTLI
jgi:hypothetical protein